MKSYVLQCVIINNYTLISYVRVYCLVVLVFSTAFFYLVSISFARDMREVVHMNILFKIMISKSLKYLKKSCDQFLIDIKLP